MRQLLEQIQKTNRRHGLIRHGDTLVVGLSGGPDSTALFLALAKLKNKYALRLAAAHVNHQISPAASLKFERFSENLARPLKVPFFKKKADVKKLAKKHQKT